MKTYRIWYGYDLPIKGKTQNILKEMKSPTLFSVRPNEFEHIKPKLLVSQGDNVKIGTPLFHDKLQSQVIFASPASGTIQNISFGPRRVVEEITIQASSAGDSYEQHPSLSPDKIKSATKEEITKRLLAGGLWPYIKQRPFDIIANPQQENLSAIFVNCMDTAPLAANPEFTLKDDLAALQSGIDALSLFTKEIHLSIAASKAKAKSIFEQIKNVSLHRFRGPHPAGLTSTHIHNISPMHPKKTVWCLNGRDLVAIGNFLLSGKYPTTRIIALAGTEIKERLYYKTRIGASLANILKHNLSNPQDKSRIISGNVLTGKKIAIESSLGFYDDMITVIPEKSERDFISWLLPGFSRYTWSRTFFSKLLPKRKYTMHTNKNGEERALVKTGDYEKVTALDILPSLLIKAIITKDIDSMEQLGIYEVAPEDLALCSYICPSKVEFTKILRQGLDLILAEK